MESCYYHGTALYLFERNDRWEHNIRLSLQELSDQNINKKEETDKDDQAVLTQMYKKCTLRYTAISTIAYKLYNSKQNQIKRTNIT